MSDAIIEFECKFTGLLLNLAAAGNWTSPAAIRLVILKPDDGIIADFSALLRLKVNRCSATPVFNRAVTA